MTGADQKKPGSGFVEAKFTSPDNEEAIEIAKRHFDTPEFSLWLIESVDARGHNQLRFVYKKE